MRQNPQDPTRADFQADLEDSLAREAEEKRAQMLASLENEMRPLRAEIKTVESYLTKLKAQVSELEADGGNGGAYALAYRIREKQIAKFADEIEAFALKRMKASNTFSQDEDWNFSLAERYARKQLTEAKEFLVSATPAKLIALVRMTAIRWSSMMVGSKQLSRQQRRRKQLPRSALKRPASETTNSAWG